MELFKPEQCVSCADDSWGPTVGLCASTAGNNCSRSKDSIDGRCPETDVDDNNPPDDVVEEMPPPPSATPRPTKATPRPTTPRPTTRKPTNPRPITPPPIGTATVYEDVCGVSLFPLIERSDVKDK